MTPALVHLRRAAFACLLASLPSACGGAIASDANDGGSVSDAPAPSDATPSDSGPPAPGTPPAKPPGPVTTSTAVRTFAIQRVYLGEASRTGAASDTAWRQFGYDLDGKVTAPTANDVCTRAKGSPSSNQADGPQGLDNAFGAVVLPLIKSASSQTEPSKTASALYQTGKQTMELVIGGLDGTSTQTAIGLGGGIFPALDYAGDGPAVPFPGFGPGTNWPVRVEGLLDGATLGGGAKISLAGSWVTNGTFVSGGASLDLPLNVPLGKVAVPMILHHAVVTIDASGNGTFAGVLDTEEYVAAMKKVAGQISPAVCGLQFDGIAAQIRQASDMLTDGTNVAGKPCNAISIGIGFDAASIANPTQIAKAPVPAAPDPCK